MPPFLPFKRPNADSPPPEEQSTAAKVESKSKTNGRKNKASLFKAADTPPKLKYSASDNKTFLDQLAQDDSSASSLTDLTSSSDDDQEDQKGPPAKKRRLNKPRQSANPPRKEQKQVEKKKEAEKDPSSSSEDSSEDEDDHWDNYLASHTAVGSAQMSKTPKQEDPAEEEAEHIEVTLGEAPIVDVPVSRNDGKKKGPSKIERNIRFASHQLHVITLMYHNWLRNRWCNDTELQRILYEGLPPGVKAEVDQWKRACGKEPKSSDTPKTNGKKKSGKQSKNQRDWGPKAQHQEEGTPNLSGGDPTLRLLKHLSAYWKKRFTLSAPGFRRQGYKDMRRLKSEGDAFKEDSTNVQQFGERIRSLKEFQSLAKKLEGSRDVGGQLFTALLRACGLQARLIANVQALGHGWSKIEEAEPAKKSTKAGANTAAPSPSKSRSRKGATGAKDQPISLSDSESDLTPPPASELDESPEDEDEDASVIEVAATSKSKRHFDRDMAYPVYWTEVLSPISNVWIPVDSIVLGIVAQHPDSHPLFEPRGAKADRAKIVMAYVVAFESDNTAKDVTVRYLKRHAWPGKTKGVRMPVEKISIVNRRGKVVGTQDYDWFKEVMSSFKDPKKKRTLADDIEDERDLKPVLSTKASAAKSDDPDSLQAYKSSDKFVLERHLRREEAMKNGSKPVRQFMVGKGDAAKPEPVYLRQDVVSCKTVESWHKEGREVKTGEHPLKWVPMRAVTLTRKREMEEMERETGEKPTQGLYARNQTDWIIPPPIEGGVIPKNAFGNIDVYVPSMIPAGAAHVPLRGTPKICRKLGIDYAEACTGFEFGNKMAVPVLTGVVVAAEHKQLLTDAWRAEEKIKKEKEAKKREQLVLAQWKKMLHGLRVVDRVRRQYGTGAEAEAKIAQEVKASSQTAKKRGKAAKPRKELVDLDGDAQMVDSDLQNRQHLEAQEVQEPGGFIIDGADGEDVGGGGFLVEGEDEARPEESSVLNNGKAPVSMRDHAYAEAADDASDEQNTTSPYFEEAVRKVTPKKRGGKSRG